MAFNLYQKMRVGHLLPPTYAFACSNVSLKKFPTTAATNIHRHHIAVDQQLHSRHGPILMRPISDGYSSNHSIAINLPAVMGAGL